MHDENFHQYLEDRLSRLEEMINRNYDRLDDRTTRVEDQISELEYKLEYKTRG